MVSIEMSGRRSRSFLGPDGLAGVVHVIRLRRVVPDRLAQYRRGDALRRRSINFIANGPPMQLPKKRTC
jgi:hypothetical protein